MTTLLCCIRRAVAVLVVCGCSAGSEQAPAVAPQSCGGEPRPQLDCSTEVRYDAREMPGGFSGLGGAFDAITEIKALREIDAGTARFIAQARRLCDEYNKCVIDRETYSLWSEDLRRRVSQVPQLHKQVQKSTDAASRRQALAEAYGALVPVAEQQQLELSVSVVAEVPGRAGSTMVRDGADLPSGSRMFFAVQASRPAYLYLFQRFSRGGLTVLFPDGRMKLQNPIPAATVVKVPPDAGAHRTDDQDVGLERVYVAASLSPISSLTEELGRLAQEEAPPSSLDVVTGDPNCKTRALSYEPAAAGGGCVRQRGLVLEPAPVGSAEVPSLRVRTEAADDTIVRVLTFNHTL